MKIKLSPEHMMLQSVAGLAALSVNEGSGNELVWIEHLKTDSHHKDYQRWLENVQMRLNVKVDATLKTWELVAYFQAKGVIRGYILYSFDHSEGPVPAIRHGSDHSVNAATIACPILKAVLISEELEEDAKRLGLKMLLDVRGKNELYSVEKFKDSLNRKLALAQDPKIPHQRALAIANKAVVVFGIEEPTPTIYEWLEPTTYIMGWNAPGEGEFIEQLSAYGHILLPSNWAMNLTVLAAGSQECDIKSFKATDPEKINYDSKDAVSFIMSDGDNVQWFMGDFCSHRYYWASKDQGSFPLGWGAPYACLAQVAPETYDYLIQTQPQNSTLNIHAGGYYFPDKFGAKLEKTKRESLLREHAQKLNYYMTKAGCRTLMVLCEDIDSEDAFFAYRIYAEEISHLLAIYVIEYAPYEAGKGKILWVSDQKGIHIPIISCKYSIWANLDLPESGTPAKIARLINQDAKTCEPLLAWAIIHAWSGFKKIADANETAENGEFHAPGTDAGVTPAKWCVDRLDKDINVVTPDELAWRIRMHHYPKETRQLIKIKIKP